MTVISCSNSPSKINDDDAGETASVCGNGVVEEGELCDLNTIECVELDEEKYLKGVAVCSDDCQSWDVSQCVEYNVCGNGIIEGDEVCDGDKIPCHELSNAYIFGWADCLEDCSGYDESTCIIDQGCGNGVVEPWEACERGDTIECVQLDRDLFLSGIAECSYYCDSWRVETCTPAYCFKKECGDTRIVFDGISYDFSCGECSEKEICDDNYRCYTPCANMECGEDSFKDKNGNVHTVKCGSCPEKHYCNKRHQCKPACINMNCGTDNGIICGECSVSEYCSEEDQICRNIPVLEIVEIPEGYFMKGCNYHKDENCSEDEYPYLKIYLEKYHIMINEVNVAEYKACIDAGVCGNKTGTLPHLTYNHTSNYCNIGSDRAENYPANCISWYGARAFCEWMGGVLPTEEQWEKAARGGCEFYENCEEESRIYPWGDEQATCKYASMKDPQTHIAGCGTGLTLPTASFEKGISPYGLYDMAGNAWEWCDDIELIGETEREIVMKGGSTIFDWKTLRISYRFSGDPVHTYTFSGFRCVF